MRLSEQAMGLEDFARVIDAAWRRKCSKMVRAMGRDCTDPQRAAGAGLDTRMTGYEAAQDTDLKDAWREPSRGFACGSVQ